MRSCDEDGKSRLFCVTQRSWEIYTRAKWNPLTISFVGRIVDFVLHLLGVGLCCDDGVS